jgi:hypothetical protein
LNKIGDINKIYVDVWYLFDFESINNNLSNSLEKKKKKDYWLHPLLLSLFWFDWLSFSVLYSFSSLKCAYGFGGISLIPLQNMKIRTAYAISGMCPAFTVPLH